MGLSRSPAASPRIGKLSKQAGTSLPSVGATDSACFGSICQREVSNRSAAAASAEPPPMPEATGRFFSSVSDAPCSTAAAASARAAFSARLSSARRVRPERACHRERKIVGRRRAEPVTVGAECEHSLDCVPPVRQLAANVERQVELGGRNLVRRRAQGAALAGVNPLASLAFTRVAMSSSAVTSDAFHANRAS